MRSNWMFQNVWNKSFTTNAIPELLDMVPVEATKCFVWCAAWKENAVIISILGKQSTKHLQYLYFCKYSWWSQLSRSSCVLRKIKNKNVIFLLIDIDLLSQNVSFLVLYVSYLFGQLLKYFLIFLCRITPSTLWTSSQHILLLLYL